MSSATRAIPDVPNEAAASRLDWRVATVQEVRDETPRARTLKLAIPGWPGHRAGQHVDVRLVAEDGYQAQRSYSIASAPEEATVALTIERIANAEVSPYLCDVLQSGDGLEVRGPIGGYFVWDFSLGGPLLLVAGGSGIVPLMAMLRHHARAPADVRARTPVRLLYSARTRGDIIYDAELRSLGGRPEVGIHLTLTRDPPPDWTGYKRRIDRAMLAEIGWSAAERPLVYICGPTPLVESVATVMVDLGHDPTQVRTERFGPTGT